MNQAYKLVWNTVSNSWVVASELAKGRKKNTAKTVTVVLALLSGLAGSAYAAPAANTLPTGFQNLTGNVSLDSSVANQLTLNQSSNYTLTRWTSFDVGKDAKVVINQPSSTSFSYNSVTNASPTQIMGQVQSNGQFVLSNPAGIVFGLGSQVNASAITATANAEWSVSSVQNNYAFLAPTNPNARVENHGTLTATNGAVTLLAPVVVNTGTIAANAGHVNLINGSNVSFTDGVPFISVESTVSGIIQNTGTIQATSVSGVGGRILLTGDTSQAGSNISLGGIFLADDQVYASGTELSIDKNFSINAATSLNANNSIQVNADLTLAANKALSLSYGNDAGEGYFLNYAAKVNLSGASAGFSVNNQAYTVIQDINQLQNISNNLSGRYVLGSDIDASATIDWDNGRGFNPLGNSTTAFTGILDGLGHSVNALSINRPTTDNIGLIGATTNASLRNIGVSNASIVGQQYVGALVGYNRALSGNSLISNSYASGSVTGSNMVGGLVGYNNATNSGNASLSKNYSTAAVNGLSSARDFSSIGGLVGRNEASSNGVASIEQNFVNATVTSAGGGVGGLIGSNQADSASAEIRYNYALSSVTGPGYDIGGLVGENDQINGGSATIAYNYFGGTVASEDAYRGAFVGWNVNSTTQVNNNYWNSEVASNIAATGNGLGTANVGLTTLQSRQLSSYANWAGLIDNQGGTGTIWRIYEGQTTPLLRSFLKPLTLTGGGSKTYDGTTYSGGSYTLSAPADFSKILGVESYSGTAQGARNAGAYTLGVSGLYSNQQGYDLNFADGTFTINKANIALSTSDIAKTYDGTTAGAGTAVVTGGELFDTDSISGGTFTFNNKNAGSDKIVTVSGVSIDDGNGGNNYNVTYDVNINSYIDPALLSISSTSVTKTYDGTTSAKGTAIVTGGELFATDTISGGNFAFTDKNAGNGDKVVAVSGVSINDGNNANNYLVTYENNTDSTINKALLTISATATSKLYDGKLTADGKPVVTGRQRGDSIAGLTQSFIDKNAGTGKTVVVDGSYVIRDGNNGNNYDVVVVNNYSSVITPKALTISTVANSKTYDGGLTSANKPVVTGLAYGDRVTGLLQRYETKTVGENKKLLIKNGYVVQDGNLGQNYVVQEQTSTNGVITAITITP